MTNKYIKIGFILLFISVISVKSYSEVIHSYDFNTSVKNKDTSFSSDGPIVIYDNGKILARGVMPDGNSFRCFSSEISKSDSLSCFVDEIAQGFSFPLKNEINAENDVYSMPDKMLVVSDIEGNFNGLKMILTGAGVVDYALNWSFGNGHLVIVGDLFDRGINVSQCLWLVYKLEAEALSQGGKVHFILGNHEFMNLKGDLRYVRQKTFINADSLKLDYSKWYSPDTELGRWLRSKNIVEKIGDILFMHAGINSDFPFADFPLSRINAEARKRIDIQMSKDDLKKDLFIGRFSPVWFRGIAEQRLSPAAVDSILYAFSSAKMIIGHTIFDSVTTLYNNKVIAVDLEHQLNSDSGFMKALFIENNIFYIIDDKGIRKPL